MKPIETVYKGYRFRSRLEARHAVFFDTLGIRWGYEEDGYDLDGTWYLPDFWLPEQQCWVEIKGQEPTPDEDKKAKLLAMTSNYPVFVFHGGIWLPGVDDIEEHPRYSVPQRKGAYCYTPHAASMVGEDTTAPCKDKCPHVSVYDHNLFCPYTHYVNNMGDEGKLVRALYIAEILYSQKDSCHLRLASDNRLQFLRPKFSKDSQGKDRFSEYEELPIPSCIQEHYSAYVAFLKRFSTDWIWSIGPVGDTLYPLGRYRWSQCSYCFKYGITMGGNEKYLPCHKIHEQEKSGYFPLDERDRTDKLMAAYTAARQARFEHGEAPRF